MKELKSVYSKINSVSKDVELASERVDLGLVDDFDVISKNAFLLSSKAFAAAEQASKEINTLINGAISNITKAENILNNIESSAKDLGLTVPKNILKKASDNKQELKDLEKLRRALSNLRSY